MIPKSPFIRAFLGMALAGLGCSEQPPPKTAMEALSRGQPFAALQMVHYGTPAEKEAVIRKILQRFDPVVTLWPVPDEELLRSLDGTTTRRIRRLGIVVRITTTMHAAPYDNFRSSLNTSLAIEGSAGVLWRHGTKGYALSAFTGENYPLSRSETHWKSGSGFDPKTGADVIVGAILFPIFIFSALPSSTTTTIPPSEEEILAAAPRAARAEKALAAQCTANECTSYHIFRRPADPNVPLELKIAVWVGSGMAVGRAQIAVPLPSAATLEERIRLAGKSRHILAEPNIAFDTDGTEAGNHMCWEGSHISENGIEKALADCKSVPLLTPSAAPMPTMGLTLPKVPPGLGTPATSNAKRPSWAPAHFMYTWRRPFELPKAKSDAEATLLACETDVPKDKRGLSAGIVTIENQAVEERSLDWAIGKRAPVIFPLMRIVPNGSLTFVFKHQSDSKKALATAIVERHGADVEARFAPPAKGNLTCSVVDRDTVETEFAASWAATVDVLDDMEHASILIQADENDLGYAKTALPSITKLVSACAAWVGWDDPRVMALVERRDRQEKRFYQAIVEAMRGLAKKGPQPNPSSKLRIGTVTSSCDGPGKKCRLAVQFTNTGKESELSPYGWTVIFANGHSVSAQRPFDRIEGGTTTVLETEYERLEIDNEPVALLIRNGNVAEAYLFHDAATPKP